jgi:hypothetical protein
MRAAGVVEDVGSAAVLQCGGAAIPTDSTESAIPPNPQSNPQSAIRNPQFHHDTLNFYTSSAYM